MFTTHVIRCRPTFDRDVHIYIAVLQSVDFMRSDVCKKKTVFPIFICSAINDAATTQQEINKIKTKALGCIIHGHL